MLVPPCIYIETLKISKKRFTLASHDEDLKELNVVP